mgnify:FL=1
MTDYKEEAEKLIREFRGFEMPNENIASVQCAILSQQRVVDAIEKIWGESSKLSNNFHIIERELIKERNLLKELQSRL